MRFLVETSNLTFCIVVTLTMKNVDDYLLNTVYRAISLIHLQFKKGTITYLTQFNSSIKHRRRDLGDIPVQQLHKIMLI